MPKTFLVINGYFKMLITHFEKPHAKDLKTTKCCPILYVPLNSHSVLKKGNLKTHYLIAFRMQCYFYFAHEYLTMGHPNEY